MPLSMYLGIPGNSMVKNLPANVGDTGDGGFDPWVGTIPWRRKWQPTPVRLTGILHRGARWAKVREVAKSQSGLTVCDSRDCSPPGSSVHGILQARILEWVAMPSSRGSSQPRGKNPCPCISCVGRWFFTTNSTWEAPLMAK